MQHEMASEEFLPDVVLVYPDGRSEVSRVIKVRSTVLVLFRWAAETLNINPSQVELRHGGFSLPYSEDESEIPLVSSYTRYIFHVSSIDCFLLSCILPGHNECEAKHWYVSKTINVMDMANLVAELLGRDASTILIAHNRNLPEPGTCAQTLLQRGGHYEQELQVRVFFIDRAVVL